MESHHNRSFSWKEIEYYGSGERRLEMLCLKLSESYVDIQDVCVIYGWMPGLVDGAILPYEIR